MSPDFQGSIRFVPKLVSLPGADKGREVVPKRQPHRCCRPRVTWGHACPAREEDTQGHQLSGEENRAEPSLNGKPRDRRKDSCGLRSFLLDRKSVV